MLATAIPPLMGDAEHTLPHRKGQQTTRPAYNKRDVLANSRRPAPPRGSAPRRGATPRPRARGVEARADRGVPLSHGGVGGGAAQRSEAGILPRPLQPRPAL